MIGDWCFDSRLVILYEAGVVVRDWCYDRRLVL